jgi:hypothetical protein
MRRITWFDFLCALALLFTACTSAMKTEEFDGGADEIEEAIFTAQTSTSAPVEPLPSRTLDLYRPDTMRETYVAEQATKDTVRATKWASGPTSTPRPRPSPTPSPTIIPAIDSETAFSGVKPWLMYGKSADEGGIYAINVDGSGRTVVHVPEELYHGPYFSPSGFQMVFRVEGETEFDQRLVITRFPDGKVEAEIALFSPDWQTRYWGQRYWEQTEEAVGQLRWSPGGRYLAFVAALDGFSSDLYVFDLSTKEVRRLTDGPYQTRIMGWSPDGEWIVHQSVFHFGTGAGMAGVAVWAAALDGSEVRHLYDAYSKQIIETWMDLRRFVIFEEGQPYGAMNILRVSIENDDPLVVYEGPLMYMVGADVKQGLAVFILHEISYREDIKEGVYTTSIQYPSTSQLILPGEWSRASCCWEQGMCFVVSDAGKLAGFEMGGEVKFITNIPIAKYGIEALPGEDMFAVYSDQGAWLYDGEGELVRQIIDRGVEEFLWEPDGETFFILTEESQMLYVGNAYDDSIALVDTDVSNSHLRIVW